MKNSTTTFPTRDGSGSNSNDREGSSRLFSTPSNLSSHTTLSNAGSVQNSTSASDSGNNGNNKMFGKGLFGRRKGRGLGRHASMTSQSDVSSVSRKTVRFDDASSA